MIKSNIQPTSKITIYTDAKSVLQALNSINQVSHLTYELQSMMAELLPLFNISYVWIPGHSNIEGNESADRFAREAANSTIVPTMELPISWKSAGPLLDKLHRTKWQHEWSTTGSGLTKEFFPLTSSTHVLAKSYIPHQLVQIFSGHCTLNLFLHRINVSDSPACECALDVESVQHFLLYCPLYHTQRLSFRNTILKHCNVWPPPLHVLTNSRLNVIALRKFCISTKRLEFNR